MTSLPKLLPSWHDLSLQDIVRKKGSKHYLPLNPPDYGGIGIDINIGDKNACAIPKFYNGRLKFASDKCALPLFPLKLNGCVVEPCLQSLEKEKTEFDNFSFKLTTMRNVTTKKSTCTKLKSLHKKVNLLKNENHNEGVNIVAPSSVIQLADTLPKRAIVPTFNVAYVGGNSAICTYSEKQVFVHPSSDNFNKLCITPLLDGFDQHFTPDISQQVLVTLKNEPILQIDEAIDGFCVRQRNSYHLVNTRDLSIFSKTINKAALYHIAANPYNPNEILSVYEKGVMKLRNMIIKKTIWSMLDNMYDDLCPLYSTWRCAFGSHPFSAMCLNESKIYSFDFREEKNKARIIFYANNPSFYIGEELLALRRWNRNPFQHFLSSSHHLVLCDERYPKLPVMYWNHCLKNFPVYLEYANIDSDVSLIVIATQKSPQVESFLFSNQANIQPVSLNPPLLLSTPSDCVKSLKFHSYYINDKNFKRFSSPLTGVSVVPHNSEIGFTVLQTTSLGDVFYQDYKQSSEANERTYHVSTGCILTPPEKILPHLNELISNSSFDDVPSSRNAVYINICVNNHKILTPPKEISANCAFCRLSNSAKDKELVFSETCPRCTMNTAESQYFAKSMINNSLCIGSIFDDVGSLDCHIDYLKKFDDEYSKRILSIWLDSDKVVEYNSIEDET